MRDEMRDEGEVARAVLPRSCFTRFGKPKKQLSHRFALKQTARMQRQFIPVTCYRCPECGFWHIGTMKANPSKRITVVSADLEGTKEKEE